MNIAACCEKFGDPVATPPETSTFVESAAKVVTTLPRLKDFPKNTQMIGFDEISVPLLRKSFFKNPQ
jgi:hypothetical protein